jgi:hypothetical protein
MANSNTTGLAPLEVAHPDDGTALSVWIERQTKIERLRVLQAAYLDATAKLPSWTLSACNGKPRGPSVAGYYDEFNLTVRALHLEGPARAAARAHMRRLIRGVIDRLRERRRLSQQMDDACDELLAVEAFFLDFKNEMPDIVAARLMINLSYDCDLDAYARGNGYSGTMAMALIALRGLRPHLSGLIRDHAAFFVENPNLPLREMPLAPA